VALFSELILILKSFAAQDPWALKAALRSDAAWILGVIIAFGFGGLIVLLYKRFSFVERNLERSFMVVSYLSIAFIIFWGVIDRFIFSNQQPWSTTVPPLLFMIMAWFGATYNVKLRSHLSFTEFRSRMGRKGQFACLCLDNVLWMGFAIIVIVTTTRAVVLSASNFQIVLGTDNVMQWWFLLTAPLAFLLMAARIIENFLEDLKNYKEGSSLLKQTVIGGDA